MPQPEGRLVAILANPPLGAGLRTLRRVELARTLLGFREVVVENLFALPSKETHGIAMLGVSEKGWLAARDLIDVELAATDGVLLAYGAAAPIGLARLHFREQVAWLHERIEARRLPTWQVGDGARHPSRWQRWTYREHPGVPFQEALRMSLVPILTSANQVPH